MCTYHYIRHVILPIICITLYLCKLVHHLFYVHLFTSVYIIECDRTLHVGMTRKQNGGPIPLIHYSFAKYHLWTGSKPKPALRSLSHLIIEVIKLLISGKNVVEVASPRKVKKKVKFSDFFSTYFSTKLPKYLLRLWC